MKISPPGPLLALLLSATLVGCDLGGPDPDTLAVAEDMELTVEEAGSLLTSGARIPADPQVVRTLADLWIDYSLLGLALHEDSTLAGLDVSALVREQEEQAMMTTLRDSVLARADTSITDEELRRIWEEDAPGAEIRARHILLTFPEGATPEQRDSILALADSLAERVRGGADFAPLAEEYSEDPGTAPRGGDLGFFGRGQMVPAFEEAAFGLAEGEVSEPVESPFGVHVIRVEEVRTPSLDSVRPRFRQQVQARRVTAAESVFVAGVPGMESIEVTEGGAEALREIARTPSEDLTSRAAGRRLVQYEGGAVTAREIQEFLRQRPPGLRSQIAQTSDEQLQDLLRNLARSEVLVSHARDEGYGLSEEARDSIAGELRSRVVEAARQIGLADVSPDAGESVQQAIQRRVTAYLEGVIAGREGVLPLGGLSYALRDRYDSSLNVGAVDAVVERIETARDGGAGAPAPTLPGGTPDGTGAPGAGSPGAGAPGGGAPGPGSGGSDAPVTLPDTGSSP